MVGALIIANEGDAVGFIVRIIPISDAFVIKKGKIIVGIVVICGDSPNTSGANVDVAKPVVFAVSEAKIGALIHTKLATDSFEGCDVIFVVFLVECRVVRKGHDRRSTTHFKKDASYCEVDMEKEEAAQLRGSFKC